MTKFIAIVLATFVITGCSGMLPKRYTITHNKWSQYDQVLNIGNNIRAGQSLDELKALGVDVHKTKNVKHLTHLDVADKFGLLGFKDEGLKTPLGVQRMLDAAERGRGYELTVENTSHIREGGFWKDFLNFKKITRETGWNYSILIITVDDKVEYVLHKGNPNINKLTIEKNPLGPFQKLNGYVVVDLLENTID